MVDDLRDPLFGHHEFKPQTCLAKKLGSEYYDIYINLISELLKSLEPILYPSIYVHF